MSIAYQFESPAGASWEAEAFMESVAKVAPKLIKGVNAAAKTLRTNPATRPLVQALPQVVRRTTAELARQVAQGKPITAQGAARTLAKQTAQVLGNPKSAVQTLQRAKKVDRGVDRAVLQLVQGGADGNGDGNAAHTCHCQQ
jgi:hypothetical protein